jgi:hypothetical protein
VGKGPGKKERWMSFNSIKIILNLFQDSIRAVLANMDSLQPFVTEHFIVFPCILSFLVLSPPLSQKSGV